MSSQREVAEKHAYIEEMLDKDRFLSPATIAQAVKKRFGSGIGRAEIARIRMDKHNVRLGPGGYATDRSGNRVYPDNQKAEAVSEWPEAIPSKEASTEDRLTKLISDLRTEMASQNISDLTIPLDGRVEAVQTVRKVFQL